MNYDVEVGGWMLVLLWSSIFNLNDASMPSIFHLLMCGSTLAQNDALGDENSHKKGTP